MFSENAGFLTCRFVFPGNHCLLGRRKLGCKEMGLGRGKAASPTGACLCSWYLTGESLSVWAGLKACGGCHGKRGSSRRKRWVCLLGDGADQSDENSPSTAFKPNEAKGARAGVTKTYTENSHLVIHIPAFTL